jgi:hypothetical protein
MRAGLEKDWKLFLTGFSPAFLQLCREAPCPVSPGGLCFQIVTILTAVCNTNSPAFVRAIFQADIFLNQSWTAGCCCILGFGPGRNANHRAK